MNGDYLKKASYGILIILLFLLSNSLLQSESLTTTPTNQNLESKINEDESLAVLSSPESSKESNSPIVLWSKTYGGADEDCAYSVVIQTSDGGFVLVGSTYTYGAGGSDFWLVKTDNLGNMQWNKTYGGTNEDYGFSVIQTFDNGYVIAGSTSSFGAGVYDFWLVKTDHLGNPIWNKTYGGAGYDEALLVMQTASNKLALVGWTESFGSGNSDCWLIITDSQGNIQWNKTYGGESYDYTYSAVSTADGGYVLAGQTRSFGAGSYDFLLIKIRESEEMVISGGYGYGGGKKLLK